MNIAAWVTLVTNVIVIIGMVLIYGRYFVILGVGQLWVGSRLSGSTFLYGEFT